MNVSVVVPTYRRPDLLARCLARLAAQTLDPTTYEIVIADDAADPATERQVLAFASSCRTRTLYVPVKGVHGPAAARNAGWRMSRGDIVAFTDDDCLPEPTWLEEGLTALETDPSLAAVAGSVSVPLPATPTDYERDTAGLERAEFVTANCFCRREALERIGGFDERYRAAWREDSDLQFALLAAGYRVGRADNARILHPVRPASWGVSLRQQKKCQFDALLYKKWPDLYRRHIRPGVPVDYYVMLACLAASALAYTLGHFLVGALAALAWAILLGRFFVRRIRDNSRSPAHLAEMLLTSLLIPPLSIYWRLYGAVRFRVWFM